MSQYNTVFMHLGITSPLYQQDDAHREGIFKLRCLFDKYLDYICCKICVCFTDYEKAFDRVHHDKPSCEQIKKVCFYIAQYPVRWTAQSALHFPSPGRPVHSDTNSSSTGSILGRQQLRATTIHSH